MDTFFKQYKNWRLFIHKRCAKQNIRLPQVATINRSQRRMRVYIPFKGVELFLVIEACHAIGQIIAEAEASRLLKAEKYKIVNEDGLSTDQFKKKLRQDTTAWTQGRNVFVNAINVNPNIYDKAAERILQAKARAMESAPEQREAANAIWLAANDPIHHFSPEDLKTLPRNMVINENSNEFFSIVEFLFREMRKLAADYS